MGENKVSLPDHPLQPQIVDAHGIRRFRENYLVTKIVDGYPGGLNAIFRLTRTVEDHDQLCQLLGYSVVGAPLSKSGLARVDAVNAVTDSNSAVDSFRSGFLAGRESLAAEISELVANCKF